MVKPVSSTPPGIGVGSEEEQVTVEFDAVVHTSEVGDVQFWVHWLSEHKLVWSSPDDSKQVDFLYLPVYALLHPDNREAWISMVFPSHPPA